jgi:hypothetical protein
MLPLKGDIVSVICVGEPGGRERRRDTLFACSAKYWFQQLHLCVVREHEQPGLVTVERPVA